MKGRLSTLAAAWVVARRDIAAILLSRSFIFFLLGPLFPVLVGSMAGGIGQTVQESTRKAKPCTRHAQGRCRGDICRTQGPCPAHGWRRAGSGGYPQAWSRRDV